MSDIQEFLAQRQSSIEILKSQNDIRQQGVEFIKNLGPYQYSYFFDWLGLPIIQVPQDIVAMQEIIWKTKPDLIIEKRGIRERL